VRLATCNLERPSLRSWKRLPRQQRRMAEMAADLWVLTETRASISAAEDYHGLHTPPTPDSTTARLVLSGFSYPRTGNLDGIPAGA
jgi:hypothetical protein